MPATTMAHPATAGPTTQKTAQLLVPFVRAAEEHIEQFVDESIVLTAATQQRGPFDLPAYGFVRGIYLQVDATGGVGSTTVTANEDAPFNAIQEVALLDVNGAPIIGPFSGHDLFLIMKYGGYAVSPDPRQSPQYSAVAVGASASGNFSFMLRIPVECNGRDALGALANQNASSTYKLRYTLNASTSIYGVAPGTTLPTVRVRASLDAWTQPTPSDLQGNPNAQTPPAHGTTSFWSKTVFNAAAGFQTIRLPRVGNYVRNLIFVARDTANGTRVTGAVNFPDPASIYWDTRLLKSYLKNLWRHEMQRKYDFTAAAEAARGLDNGVYVEDYCHEFDGRVGQELRDGWLPTVQSTRLELTGTFAASTALTILTNDVSPAGDPFV
jgi:hypothetical protein